MPADLSFLLRYALTRQQRLAVALHPWLPAIAGTIGFAIGGLYLVLFVSGLFILLFLLPVIAYRGLFVFLLDIAFRSRQPVELAVEEDRFGVRIDGDDHWHSLEGIFQVFRSDTGTTWTVLHLDGTVLTIPADAIAVEQLEYLKSFALRQAPSAGRPRDDLTGVGMGLFSWLFGKSARVTVRDLIWLSNKARNNGIARRIKGSMVEMQSLLVVAHFPATLSAFVERAISHEWPCLAVQDVLTPTAALASWRPSTSRRASSWVSHAMSRCLSRFSNLMSFRAHCP